MPRPLSIAAIALAALALGWGPARGAHAQACPSGATGSCLDNHGTPGCDDPECCATVCTASPSCCDIQWDGSCAEIANLECLGLCGAAVNGGCYVEHAAPGCADASCCSTVCSVDPACCEFSWDSQCVLQAQLSCGGGTTVQCGQPGQGSCSQVHATPACSDGQCCDAVCNVRPSCCSLSWDQICVDFAAGLCGACDATCPAGAAQEPEACGARTNDACVTSQAPSPIASGQPMCGKLDGGASGTQPDRDAYSLTATDTDGDGKVRVVFDLSADGPAFAALVPSSCPLNLASAIASVNSSGCITSSSGACVAPGSYRILVAPGTFPNPSASATMTCSSPRKYVLTCTVTQSGCAPACGGATGSCFDPHQTPGCSDAACCQQTCIVDPACCTQSWDVDCARTAAAACGLPVPPNDSCAGALPIRPGDTIQFTTIRASTDALALPPSCNTGTGSEFGPDVWFRYNGERSGNVVVSTCGSTTDMRIAVYDASCGAPALLACGSGSIICVPNNGARVQFNCVCGNEYLIRVGGENPGIAGSATLKMTGQGPICPAFCPADINRDGIVSGADIGLLLGNWNSFGLGDLNQSGRVDGADLGILLGAWGACP